MTGPRWSSRDRQRRRCRTRWNMGKLEQQAPPLSAVDRMQRLAAERRPDDALLAGFLPAYYRELPEFDGDERRDDDLYAVAVAHLTAGRVRRRGQTVVRVLSPDRDRDGWHSDRSIVLIVTDDAPFLVDTVRIVLERQAVTTHLLVHPMLHVHRGAGDELDRVLDPDDDGYGVEVEAWTQVETDRLDHERAEQLAAEIVDAIERVHRVVADFPAMRDRMRALAGLDPLLAWLADANFVFLGAATYDLADGGAATCRPGSALGQLDGTATPDPELALDGPVVSVARSAEHATIHRRARMTAVTVRSTGRPGHPVFERFVGLLAATAYRQSVLTIPTVGDTARAVLGLAVDGAETHTGRSMRNVLETLPRDPRVRARLAWPRRARDRRGQPAGAPDRPGLRRRRAGRQPLDRARVPPEAAFPGAPPGAGGHCRRRAVRHGAVRGRLLPRLQQPRAHHVHGRAHRGTAGDGRAVRTGRRDDDRVDRSRPRGRGARARRGERQPADGAGGERGPRGLPVDRGAGRRCG